MESKKINQLATELAPVLSDLTIIGDPTTGISRKITLSQMASLFTGTVEEYPNLASFPLVGTADTIYIALDTNVLYRWNTGTNAYVELSPNIINSLVFNDANGFDGTISLVGSTATLTITTALTTGSVPFIGTSGALTQDNTNLFWNNSTKRLGINTNSPTTAIDVFGSGIIGRLNGTSTNNSFLGFASAGTNKWSIGNVQSDHRFRIYTEANSSERFTILQTGEVGIGINNPTTKLHIDTGSSALIANLDADVSVAKSISFRSDNSNRINLEVSGIESGSNAGADFFLRTYTDAGSLLATPFFVKRNTGNIGINTILPSAKLQINSTPDANYGILCAFDTTTSAIGTGGVITLGGYKNNTASEAIFAQLIGAKENATLSNEAGYFAIKVNTNTAYTERLKISSTGITTLNSSISNQLVLNGGTTVATRIYIARGTDDSNQNMLLGWNSITVQRTSVALSVAQTDFSIIQQASDGSRTPFYVSSAGNIGLTSTSPSGRLMIYQATSGNVFQNIVSAIGGSTQVGINFSPSMAENEVAANPAQASIYATDSNYGANLIFANKATGAVGNSLGEKFRLTANGYFKASNTGTYGTLGSSNHEFCNNQNASTVRLQNSRTSGGEEMLRMVYSAWAPNVSDAWFIYANDTSVARFYVTSAGGIGNFQANNVNLSDERTKKDILPLESYWNKFKAIEIVKFKYKDQTHDDFNIGVIAQQVEKVAPEFVDVDGWEKPEYDEDGNLIIKEEAPLKSIYSSDLHHATIKVLQEAMAKIEILEKEVELLKSK